MSSFFLVSFFLPLLLECSDETVLKLKILKGWVRVWGHKLPKYPVLWGRGYRYFLEQYHIQALWYQSVVVIKYLTSHFVSDGQRLCKLDNYGQEEEKTEIPHGDLVQEGRRSLFLCPQLEA